MFPVDFVLPADEEFGFELCADFFDALDLRGTDPPWKGMKLGRDGPSARPQKNSTIFDTVFRLRGGDFGAGWTARRFSNCETSTGSMRYRARPPSLVARFRARSSPLRTNANTFSTETPHRRAHWGGVRKLSLNGGSRRHSSWHSGDCDTADGLQWRIAAGDSGSVCRRPEAAGCGMRGDNGMHEKNRIQRSPFAARRRLARVQN